MLTLNLRLMQIFLPPHEQRFIGFNFIIIKWKRIICYCPKYEHLELLMYCTWICLRCLGLGVADARNVCRCFCHDCLRITEQWVDITARVLGWLPVPYKAFKATKILVGHSTFCLKMLASYVVTSSCQS